MAEDEAQADPSRRDRPYAESMDETLPSAAELDSGSGELVPARLAYWSTLVVILHPDPQALGRWYQLHEGQSLTVGRSPRVEISLQDAEEISRHHAEIWEADGRAWIRDLGSTNGTRVNGEPVTEPRTLHHGDRIQLPTVHLKLFGGRGVENAYLEAILDWVTRDDLTRVFNRRKFEEELEQEFACVARYGRRVSLLLLDIDDFKGINDRLGHPAGDEVLQQLARLIAKDLRRESTFARVGGDEFAVLCPNVPLPGALTLAERLRRVIAEHRFQAGDRTLSLTCSFGVAEVTPDMKGPADLYRAADRSLYESKRGGPAED